MEERGEGREPVNMAGAQADGNGQRTLYEQENVIFASVLYRVRGTLAASSTAPKQAALADAFRESRFLGESKARSCVSHLEGSQREQCGELVRP